MNVHLASGQHVRDRAESQTVTIRWNTQRRGENTWPKQCGHTELHGELLSPVLPVVGSIGFARRSAGPAGPHGPGTSPQGGGSPMADGSFMGRVWVLVRFFVRVAPPKAQRWLGACTRNGSMELTVWMN